MIKRLILALAVTTAAAAANAATPRTAVASGSWAYVCCGETCEAGDVCGGSGTYTCCKAELE